MDVDAFRRAWCYDVSGSLNRVDDYQPWPKEGDSPNCKASEDSKFGCFDGLIAGFDSR